MALSNLDYKLVLSYVHKGTVECKNVFYYKANTDGLASDLVDIFETEVMPFVLGIQSSDISNYSLYAENLVVLTDFWNQAVTGSGTRGPDSLPTFAGWYFQYHRLTRDVRNGRKTFAGIAELDVADGVAAVAFAPNLAALASRLEDVLLGDLANYTPCIAKTHEVPQIGDPTKMKRVPITLYPVISVTYENVSTQNTRKR